MDFKNNIADIHSPALPGRVPGFKKTDIKVLLSDLSLQSIYDSYATSCSTSGEACRSIRSFRKIWKAVLPTIIISKPSTDLCWTCQQHNYNYSSLMNHGEEKKAQLIEAQRKHLEAASNAREYMNQCINLARKSLWIHQLNCRMSNLSQALQSLIMGLILRNNFTTPMTPSSPDLSTSRPHKSAASLVSVAQHSPCR